MLKGFAWIISVGNELLIGRVVNTNAAWLAAKLTYLGYAVRRIVVVPDEENEIVEAFRDAMERSDVVISTGGLGPTPDDITNLAFCKALGVEAEVNEEALRMVREKYESRGYPMTPEREKWPKCRLARCRCPTPWAPLRVFSTSAEIKW